MRALFDVAFLIALLLPDHVHHAPAHAWWGKNASWGWASCPITQNGFARVVSRPGYPKPLSVRAALDRLGEAVDETDHAFWPDDLSIADPDVFDRSRILGPNQITDVYLLALAVRNGGRLVTLDRGIPFAAVRGAEPRHLAVL